jgi:hypothetical protein
MDRYTQFGLRGDADEKICRAVRDGFRRAGLSHAQLTQAMEWYKDHVRPGMDEAKLTESFAEFAAAKNWGTEQRDAAVSVYGQVRDQGPAAVLSPAPSAEEDAATLARAHELLRTDPNAYWRDVELQEDRGKGLQLQFRVGFPLESVTGVLTNIQLFPVHLSYMTRSNSDQGNGATISKQAVD